ncbi:MAG: hypothetical protein Q8N16_01565 [bacterium]|nr:hypothetical protein [bacterium]
MDLASLLLNHPTVQYIIGLAQNLGPFVFLLFLFWAIFSLFQKPMSFIKMGFWIDWTEFFRQRGYESGRIEKKWTIVSRRLENPNMADWKLAVIEAESLLEGVLIRMGFGGESFGDRLKKIREDQVPSLDDLVSAHQTRNNIVHDPDYRLDMEEATKTLSIYEKALRELDAL